MENKNISTKPIPGYLTSSLSAPWDLNKYDKEKIKEFFDPNIKPMNDEDFIIAFNELYIKDNDKFSKVNKRHNDIPIPGQSYYLLSFVPCRGARPDKTGTYGFIKMRGVFDNINDCDIKAAEIIKNYDSYHSIRFAKVGCPTPININPDFCKDVTEIDIKNQIDTEISSNIKAKRDLERKEIESIQDRARKLQEKTDNEAEDPIEIYTTLKNKKAQLMWTYLEHTKKKGEIKDLIISTFKNIKEWDNKDSTLKDRYFDKFMDARKESGIKDENIENTFMKYLVEDKVSELDFDIPKEYLN